MNEFDVNAKYKVVQAEEPEIVDGEPMNWLVINKEYGTIEGTLGPLPHAIMLAHQLEATFESIREYEQQKAGTPTLN